MEQKNVGLMLVLLSVFVTSGMQLLFKHRLNHFGAVPLELNSFFYYMLELMKDLSIWIGVIGLVVGAIFWYSAISRMPLSLAFPFAALSYPIIFVTSIIFFNESFSIEKLFANLLIIFGVLLLSIHASQ